MSVRIAKVTCILSLLVVLSSFSFSWCQIVRDPNSPARDVKEDTSSRPVNSNAPPFMWNRPQQPQQSPQRPVPHYQSHMARSTCEYKDLLTNLHDRVSVLATLDEDLRTRLENIDKKIVEFESNTVARLDNLDLRQLSFQQHLDSMEMLERSTKEEVLELKGELTGTSQKQTPKDSFENILAAVFNTDMTSHRQTRQLLNETNSKAPRVDESRKLDALATLLASTRAAVLDLQLQLESNITKLLLTTSNLQRRLNNAGRHHHNDPSYLPPQQNAYATTTPHQQLISSCAQGTPTTNGILKLQLTSTSTPFYVLCDDNINGGGWTVILNRFNGDLNFYRDWAEYKAGFGNLAGEFFVGLEKLHALTASAVQEILFVLEDFEGKQTVAQYSLFAIGDEEESYALKLLGTYSGDAGDALSYHAGYKFSTFDNDNDGCLECNCAQAHTGAWWYNWCEMSNLMGKYHATDYDSVPTYQGMYWQQFHGPNYSLKSAKILIRPVGVAEQDSR